MRDWERALTLPSRQRGAVSLIETHRVWSEKRARRPHHRCVLIALEKRDVAGGARRAQRSRRTPLGDHDRGKGVRGCRRRTGGGQRGARGDVLKKARFLGGGARVNFMWEGRGPRSADLSRHRRAWYEHKIGRCMCSIENIRKGILVSLFF